MPFEAYDAALVSAFVAFAGFFLTALINGKFPSGDPKKRKDFLIGALACVMVFVFLCVLGKVKHFPSSILGTTNKEDASISEINEEVSPTIEAILTEMLTLTPSISSTPTPINMPTATPTPEATGTPTPELTMSTTPTNTPTPSNTPSPEPIVTTSPSPTESAIQPTNTPTLGLSPTEAPTPTEMPSITPTPFVGSISPISKEIKKGDIVAFGHFEQDDNLYNGDEEVEWIVLDRVDDKALIVLRYALFQRAYNGEQEDVTWERCSLRAYLNSSDFLRVMFSTEELSLLNKTFVRTRNNEECGTVGGNETIDYLFLLSKDEVIKYFDCSEDADTNESLLFFPTEYARSHAQDKIGDACRWCTRSPGKEQSKVVYVFWDGGINQGKGLLANVYSVDNCPRFATWVTVK